jgi:hypothetical protein
MKTSYQLATIASLIGRALGKKNFGGKCVSRSCYGEASVLKECSMWAIVLGFANVGWMVVTKCREWNLVVKDALWLERRTEDNYITCGI